jgi:hypothetical protein
VATSAIIEAFDFTPDLTFDFAEETFDLLLFVFRAAADLPAARPVEDFDTARELFSLPPARGAGFALFLLCTARTATPFLPGLFAALFAEVFDLLLFAGVVRLAI